MKKLIIVIAIFLIRTVAAQVHFTPVEPTGLPYIVIIEETILDQAGLRSDDEIGLFANGLCVGVHKLINDNEKNISIVTWKASEQFGLSGFKGTDSIKVKVWLRRYDEWREFELDPIVKLGDGTFGTGTYTIIKVNEIVKFYPQIKIKKNELVFPQLEVGSSSIISFAIRNIGNAKLTLSSITSNNNQFAILAYGTAVSPTDSTIINVRFTPSEANQIAGSISVNSDDPINPVKTISMSGQGLPKNGEVLDVEPGSLNFGKVKIGHIIE